MNITLAPELRKFIQSQIDAGRFASPDQLVEEAVSRMMFENPEEIDAETLAAIQQAEDQIDRGEGMDLATFKSELHKRIGLRPQ